EALLAHVDAGSIARDFPVRGAVDPEVPLLRGPGPDREPRLKARGIDVEALGARPNVVLLIVESLRASETGISAARGTTPHPDRLGFGVSDRRLYAATLEELSRTRGPFFAVVTTGSSHLPYAIPADLAGRQPFSGEYGEYRRALSYADASLGAFIEAARRESWFSSTVFIITGDHGAVVVPGE